MELIHKETISKLIKGVVLSNEPLSGYTSFKIGGPAELLVVPKDYEELRKLILFLYNQGLGYTLIGNGSNLLISDEGLTGVVIKLPQDNGKVNFKENKIIASASVMLPLLAEKAAQKNLSGLEFGVGLPATLGGAIKMNAGIGDLRAIGDLIARVTTMTSDGKIKVYNKNDLKFSYRNSMWTDSNEIILEAELELIPKDNILIREESRRILSNRKKSQPLSWPNAGCIFKNPSNDSAGRLIDKAGGKGMKVGDAQVSEQHANFIINLGSATAADVMELILKIENLVLDKFGIVLSREIIFLG